MRSRKTKLLAVLAAMAISCSVAAGGVLTVNACTVENKPAGEGMISASGALNNTNFKIVTQTDEGAKAYTTTTGNMGLHLYSSTSSTGQFLPWTGVPAETMAKENIKVRYQMNLYKFTANDSALNQWLFNPLAKSVDNVPGETTLVLYAKAQQIINVGPYYTIEHDDDHPLLVTLSGETEPVDITEANAAATGKMAWREECINGVIEKNGYATVYSDVTIKDDGWANVEIGVGVADATGAINADTVTERVTFQNWGQYDSANGLYFTSMFNYGMDSILDDIRISAFYTENNETKTETIAYFDMEDSSKIVPAYKEGMDETYLLAQNSEIVTTSELGVNATNPEAGSGIATRSALITDKTLSVNLELQTKIALTNLSEGQQVGLAFGLKGSSDLTGAQKYLYFKTDGGKVLFCGDTIDSNGEAVALFTPVEVTGATVGSEASAIPLVIRGKYSDLEISVGQEETIIIKNFDPDGYFAITHKGEGNLSYAVRDGLTVTGYEFAENEEGAAAISSNFSGGYISTTKFQMQSTVALDTHMTKATATHDMTGITAEDGKVGFYGTSTGSRILTTKKYADFVMQFDYISVPVQQRGQLTGMTRYSAAYLVFGMKEGGLAITDPTVYTIGILDGCVDSAMYGDNETVISALGMANTCGGVTAGLSKFKEVTEVSELSIPKYGAGGYDATKENNNVTGWYEFDADNAANVYSFYAKTTRVKLVAVNNKVALYAAEVNTETNEIVGEYKLIMSFNAVDTSGYLGIASDSPAWFEIDNLAITPISREDTLAWAASEAGSAVPAANVVADVAPENMANDPLPTPLAKPVLTQSGNKLGWNAVEGAKEYKVTVKSGSDTVLETTVTATEIDLSELGAGEYKVTVEAVPEDADKNVSARETATVTVTAGGAQTPDSDENPETPAKKGCKSSFVGCGLIGVIAAGAACVFVKRKKN